MNCLNCDAEFMPSLRNKHQKFCCAKCGKQYRDRNAYQARKMQHVTTKNGLFCAVCQFPLYGDQTEVCSKQRCRNKLSKNKSKPKFVSAWQDDFSIPTADPVSGLDTGWRM